MDKTFLDWSEFKKQLEGSGMTKRQLRAALMNKDSPFRSTSWRLKQGKNKIPIGKARKALLELAEYAGATATPKRRIQHRLKPEVYKRHQEVARAKEKTHGASTSKSTQASLPSRHNIGPERSTDVQRLRSEAMSASLMRRNAEAAHRPHGPRPRPAHISLPHGSFSRSTSVPHSPPFTPH